MADRLRSKRGTAAEWTAANDLLGVGELGYETDASRLKVGNGSTTWNSLLYIGQTSPNLIASFTFVQATLDTSALAVANASSQITISDRAGRPAYSDGTNWRFYADDAIIT